MFEYFDSYSAIFLYSLTFALYFNTEQSDCIGDEFTP